MTARIGTAFGRRRAHVRDHQQLTRTDPGTAGLLQCRKLLALIPSMVFEVSNDAGVFLGYLHKDCLDEWRKTNSGTVVTPLTKA
jgi:hypothetical protein